MNNIVPTLLLGKKEAQSSNSGHSGCQEHNRVQGEKGCQGRGQGDTVAGQASWRQNW